MQAEALLKRSRLDVAPSSGMSLDDDDMAS